MDSYENYKGLMLCTRPQEEIKVVVEDHFVSRVNPKEQLGLNPVKKVQKNRPIKSNQQILDVLSRHKRWLKQFKNRVQDQKKIGYREEARKHQQVERLRHQSLVNIDQNKMKNQMQHLPDEELVPQVSKQDVENILNGEEINRNDEYQQQEDDLQEQRYQEIVNSNKKKQKKVKKSKPEWAYTEEQLKQEQERQEDEEVDDLLDFVNTLDYKSYIDDLEVQSMVNALKSKIDDIDETQNVEKQRKQVRQKDQYQSQDFDRQSVNSNQTKSSIQSYRDEVLNKHRIKDDKDWDNSTTQGDKKMTVEDRLVKHIADEILRNHKYLRNIHSNQSIRTLLESEAHRHIKEKQQKQLEQQYA